MKIGIISDTHGIFREDWKPYFAQCDCLLHAGDVDTSRCYEQFQALGIPFYLVRGNCDKGEWAQYIPEFMQVPLGGKLFYLVHNRADLPFDLTDADYVIYGHTHVYEYYERYGKSFLNPGSAGQGRGDLKSMVIMELKEDSCDIKRIIL